MSNALSRLTIRIESCERLSGHLSIARTQSILLAYFISRDAPFYLAGCDSRGDYQLTDTENGLLNPRGINCLRRFPLSGIVAWGARTLAGDDRLASEFKYIPVRRTAMYIEDSVIRSIKWAALEPNAEPLWAQLRLNIGAFMHKLFRQGAFQGQVPRDAYFVRCDAETTSQTDIDAGVVNVVIGFAPLKPAEFVVIKIQQIARQSLN